MAYYGRRSYYDWRPYVPIHERQRRAERELLRSRKKGQPLSPVVILGRAIAKTFWGQSWCSNLERYSDYSNRLPRGRTYVRNGSVLDLQIAPGDVTARVRGTFLYDVRVQVAAVPKPRWRALCRDCAGGVDSLVELLQGRLSKGVMERICRQRTGLFPSPDEIEFSCSCPDWASMCKHVAAVLYGVGARLDERPELIFALRKVDQQDLITKAGQGLPLSRRQPAAGKILAAEGLSAIFGIDIAEATAPAKQKRGRPQGGRGEGERVEREQVEGERPRGGKGRRPQSPREGGPPVGEASDTRAGSTTGRGPKRNPRRTGARLARSR